MDEPTTASNPRFELAVLGAALSSDEAWDAISRALNESDFLTPAHAQMYDEIVRSQEEGSWGDVDLIAQALVDGGREDGYSLVADAVAAAAPTGTLQHYLDDLRSRAKARKAAMLSTSFSQRVREGGADLASLLAAHEDELRELSEEGAETPWVSVGDLMQQVEQGEVRTEAAVPTGFHDLDRILQGGFRTQQMVTVAGRTSMGKSTIIIDIARHASLHRGIPGLHLSLEMSKEEMAARIASAEGAIPLSHILNGDLTHAEQIRVTELRQELAEAPLHVKDMYDDGWSAVRAAITSAHRQLGIGYAVIDTIQLVSYDEARVDSRREEVGKISRAVKKLARRLDITIFAVVQVNRGPTQRSDKRPEMSDLRESGDLEQDSDVVMLLHRPDYYNPDTDRQGEADVIVAKQRNGPTGEASLAFQGHYSRFVSKAHDNDFGGPYPYPEA